MISKKLEYFLPATLEEARNAFKQVADSGRTALYYSGGTEINTFSRKNKLQPDVLIDLKGIPDLKTIEVREKRLFIGACNNLNQIVEKVSHPCIVTSVKGIADHTTRNHITLGGNICGRLPYREAALPFMLIEDAKAWVQTSDGLQSIPFNDLFKNRLRLAKGDILAGIDLPHQAVNDQWVSIRRTKAGKIDYPLLHIACRRQSNAEMQIATSGYFPFPTVHLKLALSGSDRAQQVDSLLKQLTAQVKDDHLASSAYRQHLMKGALAEVLHQWEVKK